MAEFSHPSRVRIASSRNKIRCSRLQHLRNSKKAVALLNCLHIQPQTIECLVWLQVWNRTMYMSEDNVIGAFSDEQAARITGVSKNQLRQWSKDGFFDASYGDKRAHIPYGRLYSFRDLVSLQILHDLRNEKKIPLQHLKKVSAELAHLGESRWTATTLYVLGKRVVFDNPKTNEREEIVSKQRVFNIPLRVVIKSTRRKIEELNNRDDQIGKFEKRKFVVQNAQVFAGTRIPLSTVSQFLEANYSPSRIIEEYPSLNEADIYAAIKEREATKAA